MFIEVKKFNEGSCVSLLEDVCVTERAMLHGHKIYIDRYGWYYVQDLYGEWQYFATFREAQKFVYNTCWGEI